MNGSRTTPSKLAWTFEALNHSWSKYADLNGIKIKQDTNNRIKLDGLLMKTRDDCEKIMNYLFQKLGRYTNDFEVIRPFDMQFFYINPPTKIVQSQRMSEVVVQGFEKVLPFFVNHQNFWDNQQTVKISESDEEQMDEEDEEEEEEEEENYEKNEIDNEILLIDEENVKLESDNELIV